MNRTQTEIDEFLKKNEINIKGENIPRPVFNFKEANFPRNFD